MNKNALAIIMSYVAGGWTTIELSHFILDRYYISNIWTDVLVMILVTMVPSIIIIAFFNERKKLKKYFIPSNMTASLILGIMLFSGSPLGAYANTVEIVNEEDQVEKFVAIKKKFQINLVLALFSNDSQYDSLNWLSVAIPDLLRIDLSGREVFVMNEHYLQDIYYYPDKAMNSSEGINSFMNNPYYPDTDYYLLGGSLSNNSTWYKLFDKEGVLSYADTISNSSLLTRIDSISYKINALTNNTHIPGKDVPVSSLTSTNEEAIYHYYSSFYDCDMLLESGHAKAIQLDSSYVHPYQKQTLCIGQIGSKPYVDYSRSLLKRALRYKNKLTPKDRFDLLVDYFTYSNRQNAIDLAKKMFELYPDNYKVSGVAFWPLSWEMDDNEYYKSQFVQLRTQMSNNEQQEIISSRSFTGDEEFYQFIIDYLKEDPLNERWLALKFSYEYARADITSATKTLKEISLLRPELEDTLSLISSLLPKYSTVDLVGDYSWGGYTRRHRKNDFGIPYVNYSVLDNNSQNNIYLESDSILINTWLGRAGIVYGDDKVIGIDLGDFGFMYREDEEFASYKMRFVEKELVLDSVKTWIEKYPFHPLPQRVLTHYEFKMSNQPIDSSIFEFENLIELKGDKVMLKITFDTPLPRAVPVEAFFLDPVTFFIPWDYNVLYKFEPDSDEPKLQGHKFVPDYL